MNALDSYIPGGKYSSARDAYLHAMCQEGWANESTGDVESPIGYIYRVSNTPAEMPEILDAFGPTPDGSEVTSASFPKAVLAESDSIQGHFLVTESSQGFVYVDEYASEFLLYNAYQALERAYDEWATEDDGPEVLAASDEISVTGI